MKISSDTKRSLSTREIVDFEILLLIEQEPGLSQREISKRLGVSLGRVNYCLKGLVSQGLLELKIFVNASKKAGTVYALTLSGSAHRNRNTNHFLEQKLADYEKLKLQIATLEGELPQK